MAEQPDLGIPEVSVPPEVRSGVGPVRRRNSDCYLRAFSYTISHQDIPGLRLHHGTYAPNGRDVGHAWVEIPTGERVVVFDGNWHRFYDRDAYFAALGVKPGVSYTVAEAATLVSSTRHSGPWESSEL